MKKNLIRLAVSAAVLAYIFRAVDINAIIDIFRRFSLSLYLLSVSIIFLYQSVWAALWQSVLRPRGYRFPFGGLYRTILTSSFFGMFLPTTAGPDIILAYNIGRAIPEKEYAAGSLLFIRSVNIFFNLAVSGIVLFFLPLTPMLKHIFILTWVLSLLILAGFYAAVHKKTMQISGRFLSESISLFRFIHRVLRSFAEFGRDRRTLTGTAALSLLITFVRTAVDYTLALSLGIHIPFYWFLALVPSVAIVSSLPVSFGGLGIREGAYIAVFAGAGLIPAGSVSISLLLFSLSLFPALAGGIAYTVYGSRIKQARTDN